MTGSHRRATPPEGIRRAALERFAAGAARSEEDWLVVEEPLEIRIRNEPVATLMRTPGADRDLTVGFLYSEGIIDGVRDIGAIVHCGRSASGPEANVVEFIPAAGRDLGSAHVPRERAALSSCGICGKRSIEEAMLLRPPPEPVPAAAGAWLDPAVLGELPERLRVGQELFHRTGALHAAAVFDARGRLVVLREDIGRHNAVDKVIGHALVAALPSFGGHVLQVSGRVSFEIVQKAYRAGIPAVCAVSGVSTLAVELARRTGLTLAGFVRDGTFCVYSGAQRILPRNDAGS